MNFEPYEIFPVVLLVFCSFVTVIYYLWIKHKERTKIIDKGDFAFETNYLRNLKFSVLSKGILFSTLSIGLAVAYFLPLKESQLERLPVYLICLLAAGGIGLLSYYLIIRKIKE